MAVTAKGDERIVPRFDNNPCCYDTILVVGGIKMIIPVSEHQLKSKKIYDSGEGEAILYNSKFYVSALCVDFTYMNTYKHDYEHNDYVENLEIKNYPDHESAQWQYDVFFFREDYYSKPIPFRVSYHYVVGSEKSRFDYILDSIVIK